MEEFDLTLLSVLPKGFPTHTLDANGRRVRLGDTIILDPVKYKNEDPCPAEVVFEKNAFRLKYKNWSKDYDKPILEVNPVNTIVVFQPD